MTNSDTRTDDHLSTPPLATNHRFTIDDVADATLQIVEELADVLGCTPTDLKPLYYDVDPDTIERIVEGPDQQEYSFVTNQVAVTVHGDGRTEFESITG